MEDEHRHSPTPTPKSSFGSNCHLAQNFQETACVGRLQDCLPTCSSGGKKKFINTRSFCTLSTKLCTNSEQQAEDTCSVTERDGEDSADINVSRSEIVNKDNEVVNSDSNNLFSDTRLLNYPATNSTDRTLPHEVLSQHSLPDIDNQPDTSGIDSVPDTLTPNKDTRMGSLLKNAGVVFEKPSSLGFCTRSDGLSYDTNSMEALGESQHALSSAAKNCVADNSNIGSSFFIYESSEPAANVNDGGHVSHLETPNANFLNEHVINIQGEQQVHSPTGYIQIPEPMLPELVEQPKSPAQTYRVCQDRLPFPSPTKTGPTFRRLVSKRKSEDFEAFLPESAHFEDDDDSDEDEDDEYYSLGSSFGRRSDPCTPTTPKTRRLENYDPYQIFEVQHTPCLILTVRVLRGRNITLGFQDYYDTPDPYINLVLRSSPEGRKSTTVKENDTNPVWDESFTFYINFTQSNVLEINLMESNSLWFDQKVGTVYYDIVNIREMDKPLVETFIFNKISQVDIEFRLEFDRNPTLRYSLCLSTQEKAFMELRKEKTLEEMRKLLGVEDGPLNIDEVPTIAVMGSGGGFRAMTGYSGVFKALSESGVLDCSMYACGLSGSSWLLSTLYSHPKWPNLDMNEFLDELKHNIDKSLLRFLNASTMYSYLRFMIQKRKDGQPVSFTDIFGRMVGETLLKGRMETTLTDQREKIKDGAIPMPLYTCVHVKKDVPARSFQEWVEFSPYEIGLPKYGTFMDSELFGSKFFMGKLVKQYKEQPLHFLQGIWGSAFCILFKRLLEDNRRIDPVEMVRQEMGKQLDEAGQESSSDCSDDEIDDSTDSLDGEDVSIQIAENGQRPSYDEKSEVYPATDNASQESFHMDNTDNAKVKIRDASVEILGSKAGEKKSKIHSQDYHGGLDDSEQDCHNDTEENEQDDSAYEGEEDDGEDEDYDNDEETEIRKIHSQAMKKRGSVEMKRARQTKQSSKDSASPDNDLTQESIEVTQLPAIQKNHVSTSEPACEPKKSVNWGTCPTLGKTSNDVDCKKRRQAFNSATSVRKSRSGSKSYWNQLLKKIFEGNSWELLSTRRGRAAVIHNFMRGLSLQQTYPLSPFTPVEKRVKDGDLFDGNFEMHSTSVKHIYMVDAGLTFNSPYPLVLRPQREVDIILSFDFSARDSDNAQPFKELLLAEKWARLNRLPFPPIDTSVFEREGMKELYIFRHPTDPHCPVVLHFVLVNKTFRYYKKPGIPRETKEEFKFADFDIFDDPKAPYSTFNFTYAHKNFEQLSQLMEFNTLLHIDDIKEVIKDVIKKKREGPPRVPIQSRDIKLLHMKSVQERRKLRRFISRMESRKSSYTGTSPSTPFLTPTLNCDTNTNPFFPRLQQEVSLSPSTDSIASPTPSDRLADSFSRSARGKRLLHPNDIISESEEMNYIESTENDVTGQFNLSPNSSSFENTFNNSTEKSDQISHLQEISSLNKTITNMQTLQSADVCDGLEEHMSATECDLQFCPNRRTSSASKRELKDTDFTDQSSIDSSLVTCSTFQNVARSQLASEVKCPDTSKYYKTQSDSSGYGGSGAEMSLDGTTKVHASQRGTPGTGTFSIDSMGSGCSDKHTPGGKLNNHTPPNPFFKKFINMTSSSNSLSPSASNSLNSSQSLNSPEDLRSSKQVGRLNLRSPRLSPLVVSSNSKPQSPPEGQRLPSSVTLEIFSLAPEAFKSDGTPVFDSQQAKMYYEGAKSKRKFFRRQSTVSSMSSISLDENKPSSCEEANGDLRGHSGDGQKSSSKKTIMHSSTHSGDIFQTCDDNRVQSVESDLAELASRQKQQTKQPLHDYTGDLDISDLSQFTGTSDTDMQLVNQSVSFAQDEQPISEAESVIMNVWYDAEDNTI